MHQTPSDRVGHLLNSRMARSNRTIEVCIQMVIDYGIEYVECNTNTEDFYLLPGSVG
jgi:hypothetical protein